MKSNRSNIYYRRSGNKIIIEQKVDGKTKYLKQLPPPEKMLIILKNHEIKAILVSDPLQ